MAIASLRQLIATSEPIQNQADIVRPLTLLDQVRSGRYMARVRGDLIQDALVALVELRLAFEFASQDFHR
jgi:hypothetical protein